MKWFFLLIFSYSSFAEECKKDPAVYLNIPKNCLNQKNISWPVSNHFFLKTGRLPSSLRQADAWPITNKEYLLVMKQKVRRTLEKRKPASVAAMIEGSTGPFKDRNELYKLDKLHGFAHVTVSQGQFVQGSKTGDNADTDQNSPLTVGAGISYGFSDFFGIKGISYSGSVYYSKFNALDVTDINGQIGDHELAPEPEIGVTNYLQKKIKGSYISSIYGGFDYEKFSTYNLRELIDGEANNLENVERNLLFATVGIGTKFTLWKPASVKLSYSKGVYSSTSLGGDKFILYFNQNITKRFWYHVFLKQHLLNDTYDLSIRRIGVGVGMLLF